MLVYEKQWAYENVEYSLTEPGHEKQKVLSDKLHLEATGHDYEAEDSLNTS